MSGFNLTRTLGETSVAFEYDTRQIDKALGRFAEQTAKVMEDAIYEILKDQVSKTQNYINSSVSPAQMEMGRKVADSITAEVLKSQDGEVAFIFGSDPMDDGGVEGSRGGKLALYLEHGVEPFAYGFTFKTIENSKFWGGGTGFINAKADRNSSHKGFKAIGWLEDAQQSALPKIEEAILSALYEAWG